MRSQISRNIRFPGFFLPVQTVLPFTRFTRRYTNLNLYIIMFFITEGVGTIICAALVCAFAYFWFNSTSNHEEMDTNPAHVKILNLCCSFCDAAYDSKVLDGAQLEKKIHVPCTEFYDWDNKENRAITFVTKADVDLSPLFGPGTDEVVVISFRGTSNFSETVEDIRAAGQREYRVDGQNNFTAAKGFLDAYDDIKEKKIDGKNILDIVCQSANKCGRHVLIVGHSLGGAVAQAMASELSLCNPHFKIAVVTYGQPRLYSAASAKSKWSYEHWRVVNQGDPVPTLPPCELGFSHHGKAFHFETKQVDVTRGCLSIFVSYNLNIIRISGR